MNLIILIIKCHIINNQFNSTGNTALQQRQNQSQSNKNEEIALKFSNSNNINSIINIKCGLNELFNDVINRYRYTIDIKNPPEAKYSFKSKNLETPFAIDKLGLIH